MRFKEFIHPRYWLTWIGFGLMSIIVRLPHRARLKVGATIGVLGFYLTPRRRRVVQANLRLCFPELDEAARHRLTRRTFRSGGISLIETAVAWLTGGVDTFDRTSIEGLHYLQRAHGKGKGVILMGMHLQTLDLAGSFLSRHIALDVMYRASRNKFMEAVMTRGRERLYAHTIERGDIRQVIRNLKAGHIVWYGPDQDYGRRNSVFVPFFGVAAATTTALSRIAKMTGAAVVPFAHFRTADDAGYRLVVHPELDCFPSASEVEDAHIINRFVEANVCDCPEQYWWFHRRFKSRPEGEPPVY
jgi:Kdo2-lipid IVA lauroyltransferase/acyltransferase